jgi:hypothetical protein
MIKRIGAIGIALAAVAACGGGSDGSAETTGSASEAVCAQGETRECVGPGQCSGAQQCGSDGLWGACDCGTGTGGAGGETAAGSGGDPGQVNPDGCLADLVRCDGECTDTDTDPDHCGECHAECGEGQICTDGECGCVAGLTVCGDTCADTQTDVANCGACGNVCSGGTICDSGECVCPEGLTYCYGSTELCADLMTSVIHCGQCYSYCGDRICVNGHCSDP